MKKYLALIFSFILILGLLAGCGGQSIDKNMSMAGNGAASEAAPDKEISSPSASGSTSVTPTNQKLVRKIWLNAETEDMDALLTQVENRIAELSGYVEKREVYHGSSKTNKRNRYANLTIRIPAEKLNEFVTHISDNANITSTNETADDITLKYIATQSRVTALETEEKRLLELLAQAESLDDLLKIEKMLTEVRTELEEVSSTLRLYENMVDYGTIYLNLSEVKEYTVTEEPETFWERISTGFTDSLKNLGNGFMEFVIFLIVTLPYLIPVAVILGIVLLIKRKHKKRRNTRKNASEDKQ